MARAWTGKGTPGDQVRDVLIEAVEKRFGTLERLHGYTLEFLADNGGAYRAKDTHAIARSLGLVPRHAPVNSPESNGAAESFVKTIRRDCLPFIDRLSAATVLPQLARIFEHYNVVHPHSGLKMRSPHEFRHSRSLNTKN